MSKCLCSGKKSKISGYSSPRPSLILCEKEFHRRIQSLLIWEIILFLETMALFRLFLAWITCGCACARSHTHTHTKWNHRVCRVETRVFYKYSTEWKARLSHFWIPRPSLEASSKQCLCKAHGVQKESLRVATNGKDPLNQEILLQKFQSHNFYLFCFLFVCLEEGRPSAGSGSLGSGLACWVPLQPTSHDKQQAPSMPLGEPLPQHTVGKHSFPKMNS